MSFIRFTSLCLGVLCLVSSCNQNPDSASKSDNTVSDTWQKISPEEVDYNAVKMFKDAMALSVGNKDEHNSMAIAWGGFGVLYGRPVITVYVSSSRHTQSMMEKASYFTVSSFPMNYRDKLMYLGSHSGRDTNDKIADAGLTAEYTDLGNVHIQEANLCFECRLIYKEELIKDNLDPEIAKFYDNGTGMHSMYVGEIINVWKK